MVIFLLSTPKHISIGHNHPFTPEKALLLKCPKESVLYLWFHNELDNMVQCIYMQHNLVTWDQTLAKPFSSQSLSESQFPLLQNKGNNIYLMEFLWELNLKCIKLLVQHQALIL